MFAGIVSRAQGTPWPATGMTSALWLDVPTRLVRIADLTATQDGIYFHALTPRTPVGGDPHPHVIAWQGCFYLEDGHHRVTYAALQGNTTVLVRVLTIQGEP